MDAESPTRTLTKILYGVKLLYIVKAAQVYFKITAPVMPKTTLKLWQLFGLEQDVMISCCQPSNVAYFEKERKLIVVNSARTLNKSIYVLMLKPLCNLTSPDSTFVQPGPYERKSPLWSRHQRNRCGGGQHGPPVAKDDVYCRILRSRHTLDSTGF